VLEVLVATGGTSHLEVFSGTLSRFSETFLAETVLFCFLSRRHAVTVKAQNVLLQFATVADSLTPRRR